MNALLPYVLMALAYAFSGVYVNRRAWFSDWDAAFEAAVEMHPDPEWRRLVRSAPRVKRNAKATMVVGISLTTAFWPLWLLSSLVIRKD